MHTYILASTLNVYGNLTFTKVQESIEAPEENIVIGCFFNKRQKHS